MYSNSVSSKEECAALPMSEEFEEKNLRILCAIVLPAFLNFDLKQPRTYQCSKNQDVKKNILIDPFATCAPMSL
jgi:hypothetical protein